MAIQIRALVDVASEQTSAAQTDILFIESGGTPSKITRANLLTAASSEDISVTVSSGQALRVFSDDGTPLIRAFDEAGVLINYGNTLRLQTTDVGMNLAGAVTLTGTINGASIGSFTSTDQTITSGGLLTLAHGLSARPGIVGGWLKCTTAENGFSVDDEIQANFNSTGASTNRFSTIYADSTNVYVRFSDQTNCFSASNKGTGASVNLTNASWDLIVEART